jgi:DNA-binding transcriptional LysR family regulator
VTLEFRPSGTLHILDLLDRGELDLAIGPSASIGERFSQLPLLRDELVLVLRKNHPALTGNLSINDLPSCRILTSHPRNPRLISSTRRLPGASSLAE